MWVLVIFLGREICFFVLNKYVSICYKCFFLAIVLIVFFIVCRIGCNEYYVY